jgi:quinol-cytochrome oxidoreductase complex cytochrome b subunit
MKLDSFIEHIHPARLSAAQIRIRSTFCLGGLAFFLFIVLGFSGLLLSFYYLPTIDGAGATLHELDQLVPFGRFVRSFHFWAGQLMVAAVALHIVRVVAAQAYLPPKHLNWLVGVILFVLTVALDFSGYVLRWDDQTVWAAQIVCGLAGLVPVLGSHLQSLLLGGSQVGETTLLRFYVLHCMAGPALTSVLVLYHFWRIRQDGKLGRSL